ncbi:MAG: NUDIX hydrolase [Actinomycetota bacterium]
MNAAGIVCAAGGVVVRRDGEPSVLVVHRPKYDDWSLPKGKLEPGETDEAAAIREVAEETGLDVRLLGEVGRVRYRDPRGREKEVVYFSMEPVGASRFEPGDEVDEVRWVPVGDAADVLTYPHDAEIVRAAVPA